MSVKYPFVDFANDIHCESDLLAIFISPTEKHIICSIRDTTPNQLVMYLNEIPQEYKHLKPKALYAARDVYMRFIEIQESLMD